MPDHQPGPPVVSDLRVCFVGDSFVAGVGDPEHLGWVGRLAARTHASGQALTAYGLGVRRQTSDEVVGRWLAECAPRLPPGSDARVVVSFGVNDTALEDGAQRVPGSRSVANLRTLAQDCRRLGWPVLAVGPPPVTDAEHNARTAALDEQLAQACVTEGAPYVSTLSALLAAPLWMRQVATGDGAHPAAEGYAALSDLVWPTWCAWLAGA